MSNRLRSAIGRLFAALTVCVLLLFGAAWAQTAPVAATSEPVSLTDATGKPLYEDWERDATRAQGVIENDRASDQALETLRRQLVRWREVFEDRRSFNGPQIATLQEQITALGPKPEDGAPPEPDEIATRRAALNAELTELQAPKRRAEEALTRANGLISQVDGLVRSRQADRRLRLDPTPLNPINWPKGLTALNELGRTLGTEFERNSAAPTEQKRLRDNLPLAIVLVVAGLVLITRSGAWVERLLGKLRAAQTDRRAGFRVGTFAGSLLGLGGPVLGIIAIIFAADLTGLTGITGDLVLDILSVAVLMIAGARWLSLQVFPTSDAELPLLNVSRLQGREARLYAVLLALVMAIEMGILAIAEGSLSLRGAFDLTAQAVLRFPLIAVGGLLLFRLGQILVGAARARPSTETAEAEAAIRTDEGPARSILSFLGRASIVIGIVGPVLAGIGYVAAGSDLVFSTAQTLWLVAFVAVLQRLARDIYAAITRDEVNTNALIPVLISFAIAVLSLPFLALIWGVRVSELQDAWSYVADGFQIGESRISPTDFLAFVFVFVVGYMLTRLLQGTLKTQVLPKTRMDTGGRNAIVAGTGYVGIFLAAIAAITTAGLDLSSLAIVAGALSVGIGFGLQTIVSNFVSGIILLIERPISEGDWIEVGGTMGVVKDISVRATRIETFDRTDVIVPNADLIANSVTNWTKGNLNGRIILSVGVAYGSDTQKVQQILAEVAAAHPVVIVNPPPAVHFMNFGADALEFEIRAILRDVNFSLAARSEINHEIARRFAEEGIEVPFAQRDIWLRNPEALPGATPPKKPKGSKS